MGGKKFPKSAKRGSIMALVLFAVVLLLLSGVGVLSIGQTARIFSIRTSAEVAARSAADTGVTKALSTMNTRVKAGTWSDHTWLWEFLKTLPNSDGARYSYFVYQPNKIYGDVMPTGDDALIDFVVAASAEKNDYLITSLGRYNTARKAIYATARLIGVGDSLIIVRDSVTLKAGTTVDGRDSRDASVDGTAEVGTISTLGDKVVLNNGVYIDGNVQVGVGGDPAVVVKDLGGEVTGMMYPLPEEPKFPYIYPPTASAAFIYHDTVLGIDKKNPPSPDPNVLVLTEADNGRYKCIDLESNNLTQKIVIASGNNVVLHLTNTGTGTSQAGIMLGVGCEIVIEDGATLNLYVDGNIRSGTDSGFNNMGTPPDLKIWGNFRPDVTGGEVSQNWTLNAKSVYFGQIYAPTADIVVNAKGDLFGSFTANTFDMRNGGNLYYDAALRDVDPDDEGVHFELRRWYEQ